MLSTRKESPLDAAIQHTHTSKQLLGVTSAIARCAPILLRERPGRAGSALDPLHTVSPPLSSRAYAGYRQPRTTGSWRTVPLKKRPLRPREGGAEENARRFGWLYRRHYVARPSHMGVSRFRIAFLCSHCVPRVPRTTRRVGRRLASRIRRGV